MKDPEDLKILKALIKKADVMIENFRPGVMKKNGLDYASVSQWNPGIVYATVTGYGQEGPWKTKPGQDLLIQSMSGLAWLNGNGGDPPAPFWPFGCGFLCRDTYGRGNTCSIDKKNKDKTWRTC